MHNGALRDIKYQIIARKPCHPLPYSFSRYGIPLSPLTQRTQSILLTLPTQPTQHNYLALPIQPSQPTVLYSPFLFNPFNPYCTHPSYSTHSTYVTHPFHSTHSTYFPLSGYPFNVFTHSIHSTDSTYLTLPTQFIHSIFSIHVTPTYIFQPFDHTGCIHTSHPYLYFTLSRNSY